MIGSRYWATGITIQHHASTYHGECWSASLEFLDDGFCSDNVAEGRISTEGKLHTRYIVHDDNPQAAAVAAAVAVKTDAENLGIVFSPYDNQPHLYLHRDNWIDDNERGTAAVEQIRDAVAAALGWAEHRI